MDVIYGILLIALGICIGVIIALKISDREIEQLVIYNEEGIPRILDLSDPYIRIGYVAVGIAGPKNWEPKQVRTMVLRIAEALKKEDSKFEIRDNIKSEIGEETEFGLCPDCGTPLIKPTVLIAGESIDNLRCPVESCGWSDLKDNWPFDQDEDPPSNEENEHSLEVPTEELALLVERKDEIERPCPKCGKEEIYLRADGETLICWKCKHTWPASWAKGVSQK